jgi:riboflavin synthase
VFTGIVEATGEVRERRETDDGLRLLIDVPFAGELSRGESIAVSGACLTVETHDEAGFELFCSAETLARTYLGELRPGDPVNVERALRADGRFDGHVVQGHVDATGEVVGIERIGEDWEFAFSLPADLARYVVPKGSITVDGISLTVADLRDAEFATAIIPETYEVTNLSAKAPGDPVHLEVDVIAKYVESLVDGYLD